MKTTPAVNGNFVAEGTFLAMPASFPGVSMPVEASECRLHTLCMSTCGNQVFALTRGPEPHILQFAPKSTYGYAVDLGSISGARELTLLQTRAGKYSDDLLVAARVEGGARLIGLRAAHLGHGIQEWHVSQHRKQDAWDLPGAEIIDLYFNKIDTTALVLTHEECIHVDWDKEGIRILAKTPTPVTGRKLFTGADGQCRMLAADGWIYQISPTACSRKIRLEEIESATCLALTAGGFLGATASGQVTEWNAADGSLIRHGCIPLLPVLSIVQVPGGRIFASAGNEIAHWYVLENGEPWARDLGVPVSTLSVRRYGFQFSHLVCGSDGQIFAAEDDHGGHLWIYFPATYASKQEKLSEK